MTASPISFKSAQVRDELVRQQFDRLPVHARGLHAPQHKQMFGQGRRHQVGGHQLTIAFLRLARATDGGGTGIT